MSPPRLLTIAGSDSGGGAGIQADLKTFGALGGYGMSVVTAVTAQNTCRVTAVHPVPADVVAAQIDAVFDDIGVDAVKIGMLWSADIVEVVAERLEARPPLPTVLDPVMVAKSGDPLLEEAGVKLLQERLLPRTTVLTPNLPEAARLSGLPVKGEEERQRAARELAKSSATVLIKGGHDEGEEVTDLLFDGSRFHRFSHPRVATRSTHGTGCTLSSAIAAGLGSGMELVAAVGEAIVYLEGALESAFPLGQGHGPVHHFHRAR